MKKFPGLILMVYLIGGSFPVHATSQESNPSSSEQQYIQDSTDSSNPNSIKSDLVATLNFTNAFEPGGALPAGSVLTPFVVAPNGKITQGTPIVANGTLNDYIFSPISFVKPVFGTYHTGVQVTLSADFTPGLINLTSQVVSNREGEPAEITVVGEEDTLSPVFPLLTGNQYQVTADFAYGTGDIP